MILPPRISHRFLTINPRFGEVREELREIRSMLQEALHSQAS